MHLGDRNVKNGSRSLTDSVFESYAHNSQYVKCITPILLSKELFDQKDRLFVTNPNYSTSLFKQFLQLHTADFNLVRYSTTPPQPSLQAARVRDSAGGV